MNKSNPTRPKYLLMLLAAGGLMFNVACTEDGIDGLPGGFGSGEDTSEVGTDGSDERDEKDTDKEDDGFIIPADSDIWQGENNLKQDEEGE